MLHLFGQSCNDVNLVGTLVYSSECELDAMLLNLGMSVILNILPDMLTF